MRRDVLVVEARLSTETGRFKAFIVDIRRRKLPRPFFRELSSCVMRAVLGRARRVDEVTVPALIWISSRKLSRSEVNFLKASSKASSVNVGVSGFAPLIVVLLRLLAVVGVGGSTANVKLPALFLASKLYRDVLGDVSMGVSGDIGRGVSNSLSSSIVCSARAASAMAAFSSYICEASMPQMKK
jgi:hypothetical protein